MDRGCRDCMAARGIVGLTVSGDGGAGDPDCYGNRLTGGDAGTFAVVELFARREGRLVFAAEVSPG